MILTCPKSHRENAVKTFFGAHKEISSLVYALKATAKHELIKAMNAVSCPSDGNTIKLKQTATKRKRLIRATFEMRSSLDGIRAKVAVDDMMMDMWSGLRHWLDVPSKSKSRTTLTKVRLDSRALCDTMVSCSDQSLSIKHDSSLFTMKLTQANAAFQNQTLLLGAQVRAVLMYDSFRTSNKKFLVLRLHNEELTVCVCANGYLHSCCDTQLPAIPPSGELNGHKDFSAGCAQLVLLQAVRNHVHVGLATKVSRFALPLIDFYCHAALIIKLVERIRQTAKCVVAHFVQDVVSPIWTLGIL